MRTPDAGFHFLSRGMTPFINFLKLVNGPFGAKIILSRTNDRTFALLYFEDGKEAGVLIYFIYFAIFIGNFILI